MNANVLAAGSRPGTDFNNMTQKQYDKYANLDTAGRQAVGRRIGAINRAGGNPRRARNIFQ